MPADFAHALNITGDVILYVASLVESKTFRKNKEQ